jgi:ABC-2 type transport system ATP-binding protein
LIRVEGLCFEYSGLRALDDVSFEIAKGSITALVGPNGAGKTTLLRCIAALDEPVAGTIHIDDTDVLRNPRATHRKLGYLSDFFGLYEELTVRQCLSFYAAAHGIDETNIPAAIERAAERLGILDRMGNRAKELSRGLRQRLAIAQAIVHEPKLLLLDEPASGLDPEARHSLAELFLQLQAQGMTLIVSSHILTELEAYSTDMLILRKGRIVSQESVGSTADTQCEIALELAAAVPDLESRLAAIDGITALHIDGSKANFRFPSEAAARAALLQKLIEAGLAISSFGVVERDMHLAYLEQVREEKP